MGGVGRTARIARSVSLLVLLAPSGGCSVLFVRPSATKPAAATDCTQELAVPTLDVLLAAASGATAVAFARRGTDGSADQRMLKEDDVTIAATTGLFFVGSSIMGFSRVRSCRAARAALIETPPPRPPVVTSQR